MTHSLYDNRHYVIIAASDAPNINFDEVLETSIETLRYSVDGTLTFVKYEGEMPPSVTNCPSKSQEYGYEEFLEVLSTEIWQSSENMYGP
jgi:hypothetical protein